MKKETVSELIRSLALTPHVEGGSFRELYRDGERPEGRGSSGVIYYAMDAGEHADFHVLDSDEYWLYHAGSTVELWLIDGAGRVSVKRLGIEAGAEPCVLIPGGTIFGARLAEGAAEGCVMSCVTVPEFSYEHYRILPREEVTQLYPEAAPFFA